MQITDEMEAAANDAYYNGGDMRAALEAALGARGGDASKFVKELKDSAYWQSNEDYAKAAACIEDLAGALHRIEKWEDGPIDQGANGSRDYFRELARATLERWGLK